MVKDVILRLGAAWALLLCLAWVPVFAQTASDTGPVAPDFSVSTLETALKALRASDDLTEEQIKNAEESYDVARRALENAVGNIEQTARVSEELENSPLRIEALRSESERLQAILNTPKEDTDVTMTGEQLVRLEQELIAKQSRLQTFLAEIDSLDRALAAAGQRTVQEELATARTRLAENSTELSGYTEEPQDPVGIAAKRSLEAREYFRRTQIIALEQELVGLSANRQILTLRREVAALNADITERDVVALQDITGQSRLMAAEDLRTQSVIVLSLLEEGNPFLRDYAVRNFNMTDMLMKLARDAGAAPRLQADMRALRDATKTDLETARQLTDLGVFNRQAGTTLRSLRTQGRPAKLVERDIDRTRKAIVAETQTRLWAAGELRQTPATKFNPDALLGEWRADGGQAPDLTVSDRDVLKVLYSERRQILNEIVDASFDGVAQNERLQALQTELLSLTENLEDVLDQNLLWLPSMSAIDGNWPGRVMRGGAQLFGADHLGTFLKVMWTQLTGRLVLVFFFSVLIAGAFTLRRRLRLYVQMTAKKVGKVKQDNYWLTPSVIMSCVITASPIPLIFLLLSTLFWLGGQSNPIVEDMSLATWNVAVFLMVFMTWREWNRDKSLMDTHFGLPAAIRNAVQRHLNWFLPSAGIAIALVTLGRYSREPDISEGFGVLAFMVWAGLLAVFFFRVLWAKREVFQNALSESHFLWRYRHVITVFVVGFPVLTAIMAAQGYTDTAREVLFRLMFSLILFLATYVMYGLIRRTVVVAERRLALKQALERREKSLRARAEKEAAEERGEMAPPPVNYDEIDLEKISAQSLQLLKFFIWIGLALTMWLVWRDMFPALSVFDHIKLPGDVIRDANGDIISDRISLWDVMQALAIVGVTFVAARNLPGFLEVFVLNRTRADKGTRYAIKTVIGYLIMAIGLLWAFGKLGTDWSQFQWIAAALGVGIGFGLQEIIANFISGLIILFERPVRVGDYVTIGDQSGTVSRIKIRATTLSDLDNREILIPNKELITGRVTNWTLSDAITRIIVPIGIAYGSDVEKAREIMLSVVENNPNILTTPAPRALFLGFGDSSLDFEIRAFLRNVDERFLIINTINTELNAAFENAGISIPFPQRDLHIVSGMPPATS